MELCELQIGSLVPPSNPGLDSESQTRVNQEVQASSTLNGDKLEEDSPANILVVAVATSTQTLSGIIMGSEEDPRDYDASRDHFKIGFVIASVSGILMWLLMFIWIFHFNGGLSLESNPVTDINLHIILMIFFVVYLQGHGIILFRLFPSKPKLQVKLIHAGIHFATVIAMSIGLWIAYRSHGTKGDPNFYTIHSWIGLTTIILFYGQFLVGFSFFLLPWTAVKYRTLALPYHKMLGPLIFICAAMAAGSGIMMKALGAMKDAYSTLPTQAYIINFSGFFLLIFTLSVVTLVYDYKFRRRPRPEGELLLTESDREQ